MRRLALFLAFALLFAPALAQASAPPPSATMQATPAGDLAAWLGNESDVRDGAAGPGESVSVWFAARATNASNATYALVNVSSWAGPTQLNLTLVGTEWTSASVTLPVPDSIVGNLTVYYDAAVYGPQDNATVLLGRAGGSILVAVASAVAPAPPSALPTYAPWAIAIGVLLLGIAVGVMVRRRRQIAAMNAIERRRSQALREERLEKAKKPEEVQRVQQEIRKEEVVREKRREVQILEAKRADAQKTIDLLQKRHEAGALSKHQFDQMVAKKRVDLARIDAEIAEFEAQDRGSAA